MKPILAGRPNYSRHLKFTRHQCVPRCSGAAMTPAEFDALIRKEIKANLKLVKAAGLKFN